MNDGENNDERCRRTMAAEKTLTHQSYVYQSFSLSSPCLWAHPAIGSQAFRFLNSRCFSAFPSPISIYNNDSDFGSGDVYQSYNFRTKEEEDKGKIPIKAYFLSTSIYLKGLQADNLCNVVPPTSRSTNSIALRFPDPSSGIPTLDERESVSSCRFMVVFEYGSAVLFNVDDADFEAYLDIVRRHASGLLTEMRKDDYAVKEKPLLTEETKGGPDYIVLKTLDTNSIRIIGSVLGQSIAMCISLHSTLVFFSSEDLGAVVIKS